jgi:hypothetical protein
MQEFIPFHDKYMYKNGTTGEKADMGTAVVTEGNKTHEDSRIRSCPV